MRITIYILPVIIILIFTQIILYYLKFENIIYNKTQSEGTPFMAVVKLNSAEAILDFEIGKQFIDLERVYPEAYDNGETPEVLWKRICIRRYNYGKPGSKNANVHIPSYHKDHINEILCSKNLSKVVLQSMSDDSFRIVYTLEKRDGAWIVISKEFFGYMVFDSDAMLGF